MKKLYLLRIYVKKTREEEYLQWKICADKIEPKISLHTDTWCDKFVKISGKCFFGTFLIGFCNFIHVTLVEMEKNNEELIQE